MSPLEIGGLGILALFALILLHVPIGFAMLIVGVGGLALQTSWAPALSLISAEASNILSSVDLATVPLFILMGTFAAIAGFPRDLYEAASALIGHRRGGLAYATIGGCAAFEGFTIDLADEIDDHGVAILRNFAFSARLVLDVLFGDALEGFVDLLVGDLSNRTLDRERSDIDRGEFGHHVDMHLVRQISLAGDVGVQPHQRLAVREPVQLQGSPLRAQRPDQSIGEVFVARQVKNERFHRFSEIWKIGGRERTNCSA